MRKSGRFCREGILLTECNPVCTFLITGSTPSPSSTGATAAPSSAAAETPSPVLTDDESAPSPTSSPTNATAAPSSAATETPSPIVANGESFSSPNSSTSSSTGSSQSCSVDYDGISHDKYPAICCADFCETCGGGNCNNRNGSVDTQDRYRIPTYHEPCACAVDQ